MVGPAAAVAGLSVVAKLLGFVREQLIAHRFGASSVTDAFLVGTLLPNFAAVVLASGVGTAYLPIYARVREHGDDEGALNKAVLVAVLAIGSVLGVMGALLSERMIDWFAPTLSGEAFSLAVYTSRVSHLIIVCNMLGAMFKALLTGNGRPYAPTWAALTQNLVTVVALLGLAGALGPVALPISSVAGFIAYAGTQAVFVGRTSAIKWSGAPAIGSEHTRALLAMSIPIMLINLVNQVSVFAERGLAVRLSPGSVAALSFADKIRQIPVGLWLAVVSSILFPTLTKTVVTGNRERFRNLVENAYTLMAFVLMPFIVWLLQYSLPLVTVLYERGSFTSEATSLTSTALMCYAPSIVGLSMIALLDFALFALEDSYTPLLSSIIVTGVTVTVSWTLVGSFGHAGLAVGSTVGTLAGMAFETFALAKKGYLSVRNVLGDLLRVLAASGFMMGTMRLIRLYLDWPGQEHSGLESLVLSLGTGIIGGIAYLVALRLLKVRVSLSFERNEQL